MKSGPLISVLLPVRNAEAYIDEALRSVFTQSLDDFEVIAVNDGSTDGTLARLRAWANKEQRLQIVSLDGRGPAGALNAAISLARGEFYARMDADDIALPERFAIQIGFLSRHPRVGVCGSWVKAFGIQSSQVWRYPTENQAIRARLWFDSPLAHPSVMIRRVALASQSPVYRPEFGRAEDYDLWERLTPVCEFANIPRVLLHYRVHPDQVTVRERVSNLGGAFMVRSRILTAGGYGVSDADAEFHHALCSGQLPQTSAAFDAAEQWLLRLQKQGAGETCNDPIWQAGLSVKWWEVCRHFTCLGGHMLSRFARSRLLRVESIPASRLLRLLAEGLLSVKRM